MTYGTPLPFPHSVVILDRRPEYARLLATLVAEQHSPLAVLRPTGIEDAERQIERADGPVLVLLDVALDEAPLSRVLAWRAAHDDLHVAVTFDANEDGQAEYARRIEAGGLADAALAKPCCRGDWSRAFGALFQREAEVAYVLSA